MEMTPERVKQIHKLLWEQKYIIYNPIKEKGYCTIRKNKRFDSWIFKGSGSKNMLKQFVTYHKEYRCISEINDINGYRQYIPFKSWQDCWNSYITTGFNHRYLYEIIISDNPCKPYLDIEWKTPITETPSEKSLENFVSKLKQI
jgi:hypothetical protein